MPAIDRIAVGLLRKTWSKKAVTDIAKRYISIGMEELEAYKLANKVLRGKAKGMALDIVNKRYNQLRRQPNVDNETALQRALKELDKEHGEQGW